MIEKNKASTKRDWLNLLLRFLFAALCTFLLARVAYDLIFG